MVLRACWLGLRPGLHHPAPGGLRRGCRPVGAGVVALEEAVVLPTSGHRLPYKLQRGGVRRGLPGRRPARDGVGRHRGPAAGRQAERLGRHGRRRVAGDRLRQCSGGARLEAARGDAALRGRAAGPAEARVHEAVGPRLRRVSAGEGQAALQKRTRYADSYPALVFACWTSRGALVVKAGFAAKFWSERTPGEVQGVAVSVPVCIPHRRAERGPASGLGIGLATGSAPRLPRLRGGGWARPDGGGPWWSPSVGGAPTSGVVEGAPGPKCPQLFDPAWSPWGPPGPRHGGLLGNPEDTSHQGHFWQHPTGRLRPPTSVLGGFAGPTPQPCSHQRRSLQFPSSEEFPPLQSVNFTSELPSRPTLFFSKDAARHDRQLSDPVYSAQFVVSFYRIFLVAS